MINNDNFLKAKADEPAPKLYPMKISPNHSQSSDENEEKYIAYSELHYFITAHTKLIKPVPKRYYIHI